MSRIVVTGIGSPGLDELPETAPGAD